MQAKSLVAIATLLFSGLTVHAESIQLGSYAGASSPGIANSPITYSNSAGSGNVVSVSASVYGSIPNGQWVSYTSAFAPNLETTYTTTFLNSFSDLSGLLTILSDDSASVYLNGMFVGKETGFTSSKSFALASSDFVSGTNTLTFVVANTGLYTTGFDFSASLATTPEPSSIALLGTGILGLAGMLRKRYLPA